MKRLLAVLVVCASLSGCADTVPTASINSEAPLSSGLSAATVEPVRGEVGGAQYALYRPADWNGKLVVYAHGYQHPAAPAVLPEHDPILGAAVFTPMKDALLARGYALALSSYRQSGYAVKEGAIATHQLRGIFTSKFGRAERTYLAGHSLGGMVALMLAEKHPAQYDGALVMCSYPGGARREVDYIYNVRAVFDAFYPGVLPGSLLSVPPVNFGDVVPGIVGALTADVAGAGPAALWLLDQTRIEATQAELPVAIINALFFHTASASDLSARTHAHSFFDNADVQYSSPYLPPALVGFVNQNVVRVHSTPDADNYVDRYYEPTGRLRIPVLTLHTARDPVTPRWHEDVYRATVAAAGSSEQLVQRTTEAFGHCAFAPEQQLDALDDLAAWAETGVRPAP